MREIGFLPAFVLALLLLASGAIVAGATYSAALLLRDASRRFRWRRR